MGRKASCYGAQARQTLPVPPRNAVNSLYVAQPGLELPVKCSMTSNSQSPALPPSTGITGVCQHGLSRLSYSYYIYSATGVREGRGGGRSQLFLSDSYPAFSFFSERGGVQSFRAQQAQPQRSYWGVRKQIRHIPSVSLRHHLLSTYCIHGPGHVLRENKKPKITGTFF